MQFDAWVKLSKTQTKTLKVFLIHAALIVCIVYCYRLSNLELQKQVYTEEIVATTTTLSKIFYDSGLSIGAYSLTKNKNFIDRYQKLVSQISPTIETLERLVDKQPVKEIRFGEIKQLAQEAQKQLDDAKTILNSSSASPLSDDQGEIRRLYRQAKTLADQLQSKLDQLTSAEQEISKDSPNNRQIDQTLLALVFFSYVALSLRMHLKYLKYKIANQNSSTKIG